MSAYNYYHQNPGRPASPPSYDHVPPSPDPFNRPPQSQPGYTDAASPWSVAPDNDPYQARYSQHSLVSENGAYPIGARANDGDQYAENIPLQHPNAQSNWMQQSTHYPPSPEAQRNMDPSGGRGRRRRKGFFKKKIPWVTYLLTIAQIAVFIAELVRSGKSWKNRGLFVY